MAQEVALRKKTGLPTSIWLPEGRLDEYWEAIYQKGQRLAGLEHPPSVEDVLEWLWAEFERDAEMFNVQRTMSELERELKRRCREGADGAQGAVPPAAAIDGNMTMLAILQLVESGLLQLTCPRDDFVCLKGRHRCPIRVHPAFLAESASSAESDDDAGDEPDIASHATAAPASGAGRQGATGMGDLARPHGGNNVGAGNEAAGVVLEAVPGAPRRNLPRRARQRS